MNLYNLHSELFGRDRAESIVPDVALAKAIESFAHNNGYVPKDLQKVIAKDSDASLRFASTLLVRFPMGEPTIAKSGENSFYYARNVLDSRFPAGEQAILDSKNAYYITMYACWVIQGRWPQAERVLLEIAETNPHMFSALTLYATSAMNGRWPEAEPFMRRELEMDKARPDSTDRAFRDQRDSRIYDYYRASGVDLTKDLE